MRDDESLLLIKLKEFTDNVEHLRLTEYLRHANNLPRLLFTSFIEGIMRGLGFTVGFTILGAVVIAILQRITVDNLPVIGEFLAEVIRLVERNL